MRVRRGCAVHQEIYTNQRVETLIKSGFPRPREDQSHSDEIEETILRFIAGDRDEIKRREKKRKEVIGTGSKKKKGILSGFTQALPMEKDVIEW